MIKDRRHQSSFTAHDDDGDEYVVHVFVDIIDAGHFGDPDAEAEGLKSLLLDDGEPVNCIAKGEYQIVSSGVTLRSNDPNAP